MAERRFEVVECGPDRIALRAVGACSDCSGCGGRCDLFRDATGQDTASLPRRVFPAAPTPGQLWVMALDDHELLRQSLRSHGAALLGLVLGAALGYLAAAVAGYAQDPLTLLGAAAGTLAALRLSKRTDLLARVQMRVVR